MPCMCRAGCQTVHTHSQVSKKMLSYDHIGWYFFHSGCPCLCPTITDGSLKGNSSFWRAFLSHVLYQANAIGRSAKTVREFLEKHYSEDQVATERGTIKLALKALLEVVQSGSKNMEVAVMRRREPLRVWKVCPLFSSRQHICYSALNAIIHPSVCPSVTQVDQSKTAAVRIMQLSPHHHTIPHHTSFLVVNFTAKIQREHRERGHRMTGVR